VLSILAISKMLLRCRRSCLGRTRELDLLWDETRSYLWHWFLLDGDFRSFAVLRCSDLFTRESYSALVLLAPGAFFTGAVQMVLGVRGAAEKSGNRDTCYYNYSCYVPFLVDLPINNMLSHIPYFVCGVVVLRYVLHVDHVMSKESTVPPTSLRIFYGLGMALVLEGVGSMCYHMCPMQVMFQFDTAMMFTIALLSTISLIDADPEAAGALPPAALMVALVLPMWVANGVGVLFDTRVFTSLVGYCIYASAVLLWCLLVLWDARRIFPGAQKSRGLCVLRAIVAFVLIVFLAAPGDLRKQLGGTPDTLLFLSIAVTAIVCLRQLVRHKINLCELFCSATCNHGSAISITRAVVNAAIPAAFGVTAPVALVFFCDHVTAISKTHAGSRDLNRACIFLGVFDSHDVWHALSALGLALWVFTLLEIRLRMRAQQLLGLVDLNQQLRQTDGDTIEVICAASASLPPEANVRTW